MNGGAQQAHVDVADALRDERRTGLAQHRRRVAVRDADHREPRSPRRRDARNAVFEGDATRCVEIPGEAREAEFAPSPLSFSSHVLAPFLRTN